MEVEMVMVMVMKRHDVSEEVELSDSWRVVAAVVVEASLSKCSKTWEGATALAGRRYKGT